MIAARPTTEAGQRDLLATGPFTHGAAVSSRCCRLSRIAALDVRLLRVFLAGASGTDVPREPACAPRHLAEQFEQCRDETSERPEDCGQDAHPLDGSARDVLDHSIVSLTRLSATPPLSSRSDRLSRLES